MNAPVAFTATVATGQDVIYTWDFGDGGSSSGPALSHVYGAPGSYTVRVTAENGSGAVSAETVVQVTSAEPETGDTLVQGLQAGYAGSARAGTPVQFAAVVVAGDNVTYVWDFGDGGVASGDAPTHVFAAPGTYSVQVTASNGAGQVSTNITVTVASQDTGTPGPNPDDGSGSGSTHRVYLPTLQR